MDQAQQQLLTQLLTQVMGGLPQAPSGFNPNSASMNRINTGSLQEPLISGLLGGIFPGLKAGSGGMTVADTKYLQQLEALRANTDKGAQLPIKLRGILESSGLGMSKFEESPGGQLTRAGRLALSGWDALQAKVFGNVSTRYAVNTSRDLYSGVFMGRGGGKSSFGMSEDELQQNEKLLRAKAEDEKGNRIGPNSFKDLFEAQALGAERGMLAGSANPEDLVRKTEGLASSLKLGMRLFKGMDKNGVMDIIQELSAGTTAVGAGEGQVQRALQRISTMAKESNVSIEIMQRTAAEGAGVFKRMGIGGMAGHVQTLETGRRLQFLTGRLGGVDPTVSADDIARAGGANEVGGYLRKKSQDQLGSSFVQTNAYLAREAKAAGLFSGDQADEFMNRIGSSDPAKQITGREQEEMIQKIAKATGQSAGVVRDDLKANRARAMEEYMSAAQAAGKGGLVEERVINERTNRMLKTDKRFRDAMEGGVAKTETGQRMQVSAYIEARIRRHGGERAAEAWAENHGMSLEEYRIKLRIEGKEAIGALGAREGPTSEASKKYLARKEDEKRLRKKTEEDIDTAVKGEKERKDLTPAERWMKQLSKSKAKSWEGALLEAGGVVLRGEDEDAPDGPKAPVGDKKLEAADTTAPGANTALGTEIKKLIEQIVASLQGLLGIAKATPDAKATTPDPSKRSGFNVVRDRT